MERLSISDGGESLKSGQRGMCGFRNSRPCVEKVQSVSDSFSGSEPRKWIFCLLGRADRTSDGRGGGSTRRVWTSLFTPARIGLGAWGGAHFSQLVIKCLIAKSLDS